MTNPFSGVACWDQDRIVEVFQTEATKPSRELFLAAHSPLRGFSVERRSIGLEEATEEALAKRILSKKDDHAFIVVRGVNGSGKSHLIAWLNERLQPLANTDRVIFIARHNASLRGVLEQLASKLQDESLLDGLEEAVGLNEEGRQVAFLDKLAVRLDPTLLQDRFVDHELAESLKLGAFLRDDWVRTQWRMPDGPVSRICGQIVEGLTLANEDRSRFEVADWEVLLRSPTANFGAVAKAVLEKVRQEKALRETVIAILNDRTRDAIREWFRIDRTALTLRFKEIRKRLYPHRLVLLIEDISCFTGVDDQLIEALIQDVSPREKWAPLCSVVGVTDRYFQDYITPKGNVRDRISLIAALGGESAEVCVLHTDDDRSRFVARYLNALRTDRTELKSWSDEVSEAHPTPPPSKCKECPHAKPCHAAFGAIDGMGLYPFNRSSLRWIVESLYDHDKGRPAPTPRHLIYFLRDSIPDSTALNQGRFPPESLPTQWIDEHRLPAKKDYVRTRARELFPLQPGTGETLLRVWGDNSATDTFADGIRTIGGLPEAVFTSLRVKVDGRAKPLEQAKPISSPTGDLAKPPAPLPPPPPVPPVPSFPSAAAQKVREREVDVERWLGGQDLLYTQDHRSALHALLRDGVPWETFGIPDSLVGQLFPQQAISFAGMARGVFFAFSPDPVVGDALRALHRLTCERDPIERMVKRDQLDRFLAVFGPRIAIAIANRLPRTTAGLWNPAIAALQLLYLDLAMSSPDAQTIPMPDLIQRLLFVRPDPPATEGRGQAWTRIAAVFDGSTIPGQKSRTIREELRRLAVTWLDRRPASGQAQSPCLDVALIIDSLQQFRSDLQLPPPPESWGTVPEPVGVRVLEEALAGIADLLPKLIDEEHALCEAWHQDLNLVGTEEDLASLKKAAEDLEKTIEAAQGPLHSPARTRLQTALYKATPYCSPTSADFQSSDQLELNRTILHAALAEQSPGERLSAIAKVPAAQLSDVCALINAAERLVCPFENDETEEQDKADGVRARLDTALGRIAAAKVRATKAATEAAKELDA
jgi:hypothetical protein